jgi:hypothetical protein
MVRVLAEDPELGRDLAAGALPSARAAAIAPLMRLKPGIQSLLIEERAAHGHFGLLVLDGLIARHVSLGQLGSTEFAGPGDILHPWLRRSEPFADVEVRWEVLAPSRLAALDQEFASRIRAWPAITAALFNRTAERSDQRVLQAALHQARRVEDRVLLALWHFAARWGQTGPQGRTVNLHNITGEVLARFVGTRRQSVSTALGKLQDRGSVVRLADGSLLLPRAPAELETIARGQRASDQPAVASCR